MVLNTLCRPGVHVDFKTKFHARIAGIALNFKDGIIHRKNSAYGWVTACRNVGVAGERCVGRVWETWRERVKEDMKLLGLQPEWAESRDMWRGFISGQTS